MLFSITHISSTLCQLFYAVYCRILLTYVLVSNIDINTIF